MSSNLVLVHGANGHLGSAIIKFLIKNGTNPASIVGAVRDVNAEGSKKLASLGVQVRAADYMQTASLEKAYAGIDTVIFVTTNGSQIERVTSVENSIATAEKIGIKKFILHSAPPGNANSVNSIYPAYIYGEARLRSSSVPYVVVRIGLWTENNDDALKYGVHSGVYSAAAEPNTRVPWITREDTAKGFAAVVAQWEQYKGKVIDLEGSQAVTFTELAKYLSEASGKKITFNKLTEAQLANVLVGALPDYLKAIAPMIAKIFATLNAAAARGEFAVNNDYFELTGSLPESPREYILRTFKK